MEELQLYLQNEILQKAGDHERITREEALRSLDESAVYGSVMDQLSQADTSEFKLQAEQVQDYALTMALIWESFPSAEEFAQADGAQKVALAELISEKLLHFSEIRGILRRFQGVSDQAKLMERRIDHDTLKAITPLRFASIYDPADEDVALFERKITAALQFVPQFMSRVIRANLASVRGVSQPAEQPYDIRKEMQIAVLANEPTARIIDETANSIVYKFQHGTVRIHCPEGMQSVTDRNVLVTVAYGFIRNAIDEITHADIESEDSVDIDVIVKYVGGQSQALSLEVSDNGPGIDLEKIKVKVFRDIAQKVAKNGLHSLSLFDQFLILRERVHQRDELDTSVHIEDIRSQLIHDIRQELAKGSTPTILQLLILQTQHDTSMTLPKAAYLRRLLDHGFTTKTMGSGVGLGLADELMTLVGGTVRPYDNVRMIDGEMRIAGATFHALLPNIQANLVERSRAVMSSLMEAQMNDDSQDTDLQDLTRLISAFADEAQVQREFDALCIELTNDPLLQDSRENMKQTSRSDDSEESVDLFGSVEI